MYTFNLFNPNSHAEVPALVEGRTISSWSLTPAADGASGATIGIVLDDGTELSIAVKALSKTVISTDKPVAQFLGTSGAPPPNLDDMGLRSVK